MASPNTTIELTSLLCKKILYQIFAYNIFYIKHITLIDLSPNTCYGIFFKEMKFLLGLHKTKHIWKFFSYKVLSISLPSPARDTSLTINISPFKIFTKKHETVFFQSKFVFVFIVECMSQFSSIFPVTSLNYYQIAACNSPNLREFRKDWYTFFKLA